MYNVGDRVKFVNLIGNPWEGTYATVSSIDGNTFWFKRDDNATGTLERGDLERHTKLLAPISLENK